MVSIAALLFMIVDDIDDDIDAQVIYARPITIILLSASSLFYSYERAVPTTR
jgi:hypothetical protein